MYSSSGKGMTDAFYNALATLMQCGKEVPSRNGDTRELHPMHISILNPQDRILLAPGRKNNIAASIFETMWVLAGGNNITMLSKFLPRAPHYSDDGITWRGAYGPRIRTWENGTDTWFDQVQMAYQLLSQDQETRQAVIAIFDPAKDYVKSKDIPCNNLIYFLVRNGKLDMTVTIRSNDAFWGFSQINVFEWTVLQEMMAQWLGLPVGTYYHSANSFHIYKEHWAQAQIIIDDEYKWRASRNSFNDHDSKPFFPEHLATFDEFDNAMEIFHIGVKLATSLDEYPNNIENMNQALDSFGPGGSIISDYLRVVYSELLLKTHPINAVEYLNQLAPLSKLQVAALVRAERRVSGFVTKHFPIEFSQIVQGLL
jgi:thymidylate synthase